MSTKVRFVCQQCGAVSPRWLGKCSECDGWNTLAEEVAVNHAVTRATAAGAAQPILLSEVSASDAPRFPTDIQELDRVLGGGLVPGSVILLGGDPGIGKSTLALQLASRVSARQPASPVLYVSGEESLPQVKMRADRLLHDSGGRLHVLSETNLTAIEAAMIQMRPAMAIMDSIQSLAWEDIPSAAGSVSQIRECAARLIRLAKAHHIALLLIGHVTKEGNIAGPKLLEHMVDTVLYFEGEAHRQFRIIRAFKNRFGSTNEIGVFEMRDTGLMEVSNPSAIFLRDRTEASPGSVVIASIEGTRPLLVEVQALVAPASGFGAPRRTVSGIDSNRLAIILAVLEKKAQYKLSQYDVFVNVVGGVEIDEPAADLGIALAILSSLKNKPLPPMTAVFGELGLSGEVRPVSHAHLRLQEIQKLGFTHVILPDAPCEPAIEKALALQKISRIWEEVF